MLYEVITHDEAVTLGIAGTPVATAGIGVTKTSVLTDGDGDTATDSVTYNLTADVVIEDDGPQIDITTSGASLTLGLDESIVNPTSTSDESGSIAAGVDDILGVTAPDGINPFGSITTGTGNITGLFSDVLVDAGTDGDDRADSYVLALTDGAGAAVANAATFAAAEGVATTLNVTDADGATYVNDNIVLFKISDTGNAPRAVAAAPRPRR